MSDKIIWLIILFVFLIIIGLYISDFTPLDLSEKQQILKLNYNLSNYFYHLINLSNYLLLCLFVNLSFKFKIYFFEN